MNTDAEYRLLEAGELIEPNDQYLVSNLEWSATICAGAKVARCDVDKCRRRIPGSAEPTPTNQHPKGTDTTSIYRVAITYTPSALDVQKGETESIILPTVEVMADANLQAVAIAVLDNSDKLKALQGKPTARWSVKTASAY